MRKKSILILLIVFIFIFSLNNESKAAETPVKISINGKIVESDVEPFIENGRTMVPIRVITENLGYNVDWYEETQEIVIFPPGYENSGYCLTLTIGDTTAYLWEIDVVTMEVAPKLINSRTFVPLRFIVESFGVEVQWDEKNWMVIINNGPQTIPEFPIAERISNVKIDAEEITGIDFENMYSTADMVSYSNGLIESYDRILKDLLNHLEKHYEFPNVNEFTKKVNNDRKKYAEEAIKGLDGSMVTLEYNGALIAYTHEVIRLLSEDYLEKSIEL